VPGPRRGTVLVTGAGRRRSIGAGLAVGLAEDGWDLVLNYWAPYDDRVGYARGEHDSEDVAAECRRRGARVEVLAADLAEAGVPARLVEAAAATGGLRGLVMSHCESVDSSILTTTVESWDRHFQVNARAAWLLLPTPRPAGLARLMTPPTSCDSSCQMPVAGSPVRFSTAMAGLRHQADITTGQRHDRMVKSAHRRPPVAMSVDAGLPAGHPGDGESGR